LGEQAQPLHRFGCGWCEEPARVGLVGRKFYSGNRALDVFRPGVEVVEIWMEGGHSAADVFVLALTQAKREFNSASKRSVCPHDPGVENDPAIALDTLREQSFYRGAGANAWCHNEPTAIKFVQLKRSNEAAVIYLSELGTDPVVVPREVVQTINVIGACDDAMQRRQAGLIVLIGRQNRCSKPLDPVVGDLLQENAKSYAACP
jgi:hypothetical protein